MNILLEVCELSITFSRIQNEGVTEYKLVGRFACSLACKTIACRSCKDTVYIYTRYSEILQLHKYLIDLNEKRCMPVFPGKGYLVSSTSKEFLDQRVIQLNNYFKSLITIPSLGG